MCNFVIRGNCKRSVKEFTERKIKKAIVDRGYKGQDKIGATEIVMPNTHKKERYYLKKQREARCRSRAGIEGLISHLKHDHRMLRNFLKGTAGEQISTLLAASAYNIMKWMSLKREEIIVAFLRWFLPTTILVKVNSQRSEICKNVYC